LASGGDDGKVKTWDAASGEELASMAHGGGTVRSVCFLAFVHETLAMRQLGELKDGKPQYAEIDGSQRKLHYDGEHVQWCLVEGSGAVAATVADDAATPHDITAVWEPGPGAEKMLQSLQMADTKTSVLLRSTFCKPQLVEQPSENADLIEQDELHCGRPLYKTVDGTSELCFDASSGQWQCRLHNMAPVYVKDAVAATPLEITGDWTCQDDGVDITSFACAELHGGRSSQLTRVGDRTVGLDQSNWNLGLDDGSTVRSKILDFAGQEEYYLTHKLFLTSGALYVVAFDASKYSPRNFHRTVLFWVLGIQNAAPGTVLVIAATHADLLTKEELQRRCTHAMVMLKQRQSRIRTRLQRELDAAKQQMTRLKSAAAIGMSEEAKAAKQAGYEAEAKAKADQLAGLVVLPERIVGVSSAAGLYGIDDLRRTIKDAVQKKGHFPQIGAKIPLSYDQVRRFTREMRLESPHMSFDAFADALHSQYGLDSELVLDRAAVLLHDQGELLRYDEKYLRGQPLVFLSLRFLVDLFKLLLRHDHEQATVYDDSFGTDTNGIDSIMDEQAFDDLKRAFLRRGRLDIALLRQLWRPFQFDGPTFNSMVQLMERFDIGMISQVDEDGHPQEFLLPSFFPAYLPPRLWSNECPAAQTQTTRLFRFRDWMPAGLMQRLQVCLHRVAVHSYFAQKCTVVVIGACQVLCRCTVDRTDSAFTSSPVLEVVARAADAQQLWLSYRTVFSLVIRLLAQWPGLGYGCVVVHRLTEGGRAFFPLTKLEQMRMEGVTVVPAVTDVDDGDGDGAHEMVPIETLLGPAAQQLDLAEGRSYGYSSRKASDAAADTTSVASVAEVDQHQQQQQQQQQQYSVSPRAGAGLSSSSSSPAIVKFAIGTEHIGFILGRCITPAPSVPACQWQCVHRQRRSLRTASHTRACMPACP
jgi:hypothetical protein